MITFNQRQMTYRTPFSHFSTKKSKQENQLLFWCRHVMAMSLSIRLHTQDQENPNSPVLSFVRVRLDTVLEY